MAQLTGTPRPLAGDVIRLLAAHDHFLAKNWAEIGMIIAQATTCLK